MTTEKRESEQGNVFSVTIIRDFLLAALSHDAVADAVDAMLFEHVIEGRLHQSVITENLRPLITEVLDVATLEDWQYVSGKLIADAREVMQDDTRSDDAVRADRSSAQTPASSTGPVIDAGTQPVVAAYQMLRHLADQGGAVYIEDTRGKEVQGWVTGVATHEVSIEEIRSRKTTYIRLADIENMEEIEAVFVRPLSRHEASALLDAGESRHSWTRKRAAILLASNFGITVAEIAATQKAEAWFVRRVITAFNERGLKSLEGSTLTMITLDNGQFNLLISGLGLARLALNGCGDEFVGFARDYSQLADEIVAQLPGEGPAPRAARERLAIQEGRATSIRKPS